MDSAIPTSVTPFNFEALPVEVQKSVLPKYFEDSCEVRYFNKERLRNSCYFRLQRDDKDAINIRRAFGPEARIAFVNKHFFKETMEALKNSPHTIIKFDGNMLADDIAFAHKNEQIWTFTKHARTIYTNSLSWTDTPSRRELPIPFIGLAPKLTIIHVGEGYFASSVVDELSEDLNSITLRSIMKGQEDSHITTKLEEILEGRNPDMFSIMPFRNLTITLPLRLEIYRFWREEILEDDALGWSVLYLRVEINNMKTTIVGNKAFFHCGLWVEATEDTMDRLYSTKCEDPDFGCRHPLVTELETPCCEP